VLFEIHLSRQKDGGQEGVQRRIRWRINGCLFHGTFVRLKKTNEFRIMAYKWLLLLLSARTADDQHRRDHQRDQQGERDGGEQDAAAQETEHP
jgi:hypothetical protein